MKNGTRFHLIDTLRGVAVVNMVVFHFCWDLFSLGGLFPDWMDSAYVAWWQKLGCMLFILLCGFCFSLSRSHIKRGLFLLSAGWIISFITSFLDEEMRIRFGILSFLGICILLLACVERLLKRIHPVAGLIVCILFFVLTEHIAEGYIAVFGIDLINLPVVSEGNTLLFYLGLYTKDMVSADYFPIIPWCFIFAGGYFLYRFVEHKNRFVLLTKGKCKPIEWIGQHSLIIYLVHQPIMLPVFLLFN